MGRHSKPSKAKTLLKRTGATAALAGAALAGFGTVGAGTADAFPGQAGLVACESGGNPHAVNNTAAGRAAGRPAGLFQIVTSTWLANGGGQFAPTADKAAPWQQQIVADRIYARQGTSPWECKAGPGPAAFSYFGAATHAAQTSVKTEAATSASVTTKPSPSSGAKTVSATHAVNTSNEYTVVAGDTLSGIAQKFQVPGGWVKLQKLNSIRNANLIFPGQKIALK